MMAENKEAAAENAAPNPEAPVENTEAAAQPDGAAADESEEAASHVDPNGTNGHSPEPSNGVVEAQGEEVAGASAADADAEGAEPAAEASSADAEGAEPAAEASSADAEGAESAAESSGETDAEGAEPAAEASGETDAEGARVAVEASSADAEGAEPAAESSGETDVEGARAAVEAGSAEAEGAAAESTSGQTGNDAVVAAVSTAGGDDAAGTKTDEAQSGEGEQKAAPESSRPEMPSEEMSFAEMFELAEKQSAERRKKQSAEIGGNIRPGQVIFAKVVGFSHDSVFLDVGAKAEGIISKAELADENGDLDVKEGDKVEARVRKFEGGAVILSKVLPHQSLKNREELREAHRIGMPVEGRVTGQNKGGYDVEVSGLRAFCPASQIDLRPGKAENYIGKKFHFKLSEFKDNGRNIVVSRRVILEEEAKKKAEEVLKTLEVGSVVDGVVTSLKDYGAFVDIGGLEGLVHLSEITYGHIKKPSEVLKVGYPVKAQVLKIEDGKGGTKKISLSMKALTEDPWVSAQASIKEGMKVRGKVARIQDFGAFVEIMPGVDGLVHISNMSLDRRVKNPRDVVKVGDEIEATVIKAEWDKRRIGLSLVKTPQELANELARGKVFEGSVDRVEGFGIFVKLPNGARGLVPAAETGTQRGADLKKEFENGQKVKVVVQDLDTKSGRIRMSIRAAKEAEERAEFEGYMSTSNKKGKGLGTLGDLLKKQLGDKIDTLRK